jgi:hypothetical protein
MPSQLVTSVAIACFMIAIVSVAEAGTKKSLSGWSSDDQQAAEDDGTYVVRLPESGRQGCRGWG